MATRNRFEMIRPLISGGCRSASRCTQQSFPLRTCTWKPVSPLSPFSFANRRQEKRAEKKSNKALNVSPISSLKNNCEYHALDKWITEKDRQKKRNRKRYTVKEQRNRNRAGHWQENSPDRMFVLNVPPREYHVRAEVYCAFELWRTSARTHTQTQSARKAFIMQQPIKSSTKKLLIIATSQPQASINTFPQQQK